MAKDIHAQSVPLPKFPMSAFDLGHSMKYTTSAGKMACHYLEECIPSDIAHIKTDLFIRLDPLTFPIMHKVKVRQNFFFVPTRLLLGDELNEDFFSCKDLSAKLPSLYWNEDDEGPCPFCSAGNLSDMMGIQPVVYDSANKKTRVLRNPLPLFAYQKVWADYYADEVFDSQALGYVEQDLDSYRSVGLNGSLDASGLMRTLYYNLVSYSKDRFTSAQPDAQRVGEVYLMNPLSLERVDGVPMPSVNTTVCTDSSGLLKINQTGYPSLRTDLTIDELWDEMAVQRFLNSLNEFGNERYIEILAGQFGVISQDARLQRSQWLGGNECVVNISEVLQTSETTSASPLGSYGGRGIVAGKGRDISFRVPEHGYIIGIQTIVPENGYASGTPRLFYKSTPLDFAMPRFNNLGESSVYNGELFSDHLADALTNDLGEFGYQPQYDEYRSHPSRSTMEFRDSQFLAWHLDRKFTSVPPLNANFIHINNVTNNRIFNDTDTEADHYRVHAFHKAMYVRPISRHPVPGKL